MRKRSFPRTEKAHQARSGLKKKKNDAAAKIDDAIKAALDELDFRPERPEAFRQLLAHVRAQTELLKPTPGQGSTGWKAPVFLVNRLKNLAARAAMWIRPLDAWRAQRTSLRREFRALAWHLLALYPVPGFMDGVWDLPDGPEAFKLQTWFIRLGRGTKLRSLPLPISLTKRMEHHVRRAPDDFGVMRALRYGETRGLGGSHQLANVVAASPLGADVMNARFWRTVLQFLATQPQMSPSSVRLIIDFIRASKFGGEKLLTVGGIETRSPTWADFSLQGRTLNSVLRLVRDWRLELGGGTTRTLAWEPTGLRAFRYLERTTDQTEIEWSIVELLSSESLHAEGRSMCHCVYTYVHKCYYRLTSIWSLRVKFKGEEKRILTIEVDPRRRQIVQVRGKYNRTPGTHSETIVRRWAQQEGVRFADEP